MHYVVHFGIELNVSGQTGPKVRPWACNETHCKFTLEHEDGDSKERAVGEEAEDEFGGDLIRGIGNAGIKVRYIHFDKVSDNDVELSLLGSGNRKK
jgi:hypothetical protein